MPSVQRTSLAHEDLVAIALHIAQADPSAANARLDATDAIMVVRVLPGARDLPSLFAS
jgi:plasmid stabilization system protein ParE